MFEKINNNQRLISLDVFRGLTIALMIVVNSPGNLTPYHWLEHAAWNGCTLADLVFPFFILIVGVSSALALSILREKGVSKAALLLKVCKRTVFIFLVGLALNAFPNHFHWDNLRLLGVLQRIALCYFCSATLFLTCRIRSQFIIMLAILIAYYLLIRFFSPVYPLSVEYNIVASLDRFIFAAGHLYRPGFDPEGLLSTLPAVATALLGNILGARLLVRRFSKMQQLRWIVAGGLILLVLGFAWSFVFPWNKSLWTSSYVLWTGGFAYLLYAFCYFCIEIKGWQAWFKPFFLFGRQAMLVYVLHVVFLKIQANIWMTGINGELMNLRLYLTELCFGSFSPENAALAYAISYTIFWLLVLQILIICRRKSL